MKKTVDNKFYEVNDFWGDQMPMMAMEEMAELTQAISKYERYKKRVPQEEQWDKYSYIIDIVKEMGDVIISLQALIARYDIDLDEIEYYVDNKLERTYE